MTGLGNRRSFDADLSNALAQGGSSAFPVALIVIDVDHFKRFNDRYGHPAGDVAFCQIAQMLSAAADRSEIVAYRIGGEEFAIIVTGKERGFSQKFAEDLLGTVRSRRILNVDSEFGIVTRSLGVSEVQGNDPSLAMASADAARTRAAERLHVDTAAVRAHDEGRVEELAAELRLLRRSDEQSSQSIPA